jgi:hypothetical protein
VSISYDARLDLKINRQNIKSKGRFSYQNHPLLFIYAKTFDTHTVPLKELFFLLLSLL